MVTQDSTPSGQVRSTTTPTGEESVTTLSQPSGLGELSTSMFTESDRKLEAIQRAQVGSLMGADRNKESQEKTPKRQSPPSATRPKKYALELWVEIETSAGVYSTPDEDSWVQVADRMAHCLENKFLCEQALVLNSSSSNIFLFFL